ncbi:MAG: hypothetical protein ACK53A_12130 [Gemmatimonadota bacterium]|jgi:hypothetical protein
MTLILGQLAPDGSAHVVADRAMRVFGTYTMSVGLPKVWHPSPRLILGVAGTTSWSEAVRAWRVPDFARDVHGLDLLRLCAADLAELAPKGATCAGLLATLGAIYPFQLGEGRDVAPMIPADGTGAVGSGALAALAAMRAYGSMQTAPLRLLGAARITAELQPGDVAGPFDLLSVEANASAISAADSQVTKLMPP